MKDKGFYMNRLIAGIAWDTAASGNFDETQFTFNLIAPRGIFRLEYIDIFMTWTTFNPAAILRSFDNVGQIYIDGLIADFSFPSVSNGGSYRRSFKDESRIPINLDFNVPGGLFTIYFTGSGLGFNNGMIPGDTLDAMIGIKGISIFEP